MPEYLAPGVYVEETSFRAKSIEGVGTSTTAFVGPTRRGPLATTVLDAQRNPPAPPEMLTSFGDFVRTYGGLGDLDFGPNFLAHAVLSFFNEGGSRLYVARVATGAAAASVEIAGAAGANDQVFVRARFPGRTGNGTLTVREVLTSGTVRALDRAPEGTVMRAGGGGPVEPARIVGGRSQGLRVPNGAVLRLLVSGTVRPFRLHGEHTEATGATALTDPVVINNTNDSLTVTLDGTPQMLTFPARNYTPAELTLALNERLERGYARVAGDGRLVIGTDRRGHAGRVQVTLNDAFGFTAAADAQGAFHAADNNLPNLENFTAAQLALALDGLIPNAVVVEDVGGRLVISTPDAGEDQTLAAADATDTSLGVVSAHAALGFTVPGAGEPHARGSNMRLYRKTGNQWTAAGAPDLVVPPDPNALVGDLIQLLVSTQDAEGESDEYDAISLAAGDPRYIGRLLGLQPLSRADGLQRVFGFDIGAQVDSVDLHAALFRADRRTGTPETGFTAVHTLGGGTDGGEPIVGAPTDDGSYAAALEQLRGLEDVSIIAAPGHSAMAEYRNIQGALIRHVHLPRAYRIAVLDTPRNQLPGEAREERARIDSTRAAMYYPWVTVANPLARPGRDDIAREINLPPSGFLCGIYARNDVEQTVAKAPANEVVRGALRFESDVNFAQNQLLNPIGVNCLRYFPGRGFRVWGARTAGSDPEIKYVNVRRYLLYLEASIDRGTQWAVFENNGPRLWTNITETVESFLYNEWVSNNLLGSTPREAFFVRCDRSTMTQNDLDNGRLICLIGVALLKPAEFVIFRIGQKTADARS